MVRRPIDYLIKPFVIALLLATVPAGCSGQNAQAPLTTTQEDPRRHRAEELYSQGKFVDALSLFEALAADHPSDLVVRERWAWCLFQYAGTLPDLI